MVNGGNDQEPSERNPTTDGTTENGDLRQAGNFMRVRGCPRNFVGGTERASSSAEGSAAETDMATETG